MARPALKVVKTILFLTLAGGLVFLASGWLRTSLARRQVPSGVVPAATRIAQAAATIPAAHLPDAIEDLEHDVGALQAELYRLDRALMKYRPHNPYIVIDAAHNRLFLKKGGKALRRAICSTGSGKVLKDPLGGRSWIFSTPRGEFHVTNKLENPTWRKPDWAFVEEGEPVPTRKDAVERFEDGVLGEYALAFGNGYLIHGTLYTRLLGRSVTHGCVRLGPIDLKSVYDASPLRTKIYIF
ncbi:MAG: L,D-transpeptidase [Acidobacteriota bacterium]